MLKDMVIEIADAKYFSKLLYKMLFTFNKQNFEILELFIISLFVYMVYTMFIQNRVEAHNCTGHRREPFINLSDQLPDKKKEGVRLIK